MKKKIIISIWADPSNYINLLFLINYFLKKKNLKKKHQLNKIILIENISYKTWFVILKNAIAGFALYKPINTSHKLMGGTSQKLNNYIFASIPSFINNNKDFLDFNKIQYFNSG